nr:MAG TPA: hypothetical protein [Caudoviricetes sp.]
MRSACKLHALCVQLQAFCMRSAKLAVPSSKCDGKTEKTAFDLLVCKLQANCMQTACKMLASIG